MGRSETYDRPPEGSAKRGLLRLMLKLPSLRGQLQLLDGRSQSLSSLCEAYEDACTTLARLLQHPRHEDRQMTAEYQNICGEIETDVIRYCLDNKRVVP